MLLQLEELNQIEFDFPAAIDDETFEKQSQDTDIWVTS